MKFRKIYGFCWEILIDKEWYFLCVCKNCGKVHAGNICIADEEIKCCEKPDNLYRRNDESIEAFVKKWSD